MPARGFGKSVMMAAALVELREHERLRGVTAGREVIVVIDELANEVPEETWCRRVCDLPTASELQITVTRKEDPPEFPRNYRERPAKDWEQREYKRPKRRRR